jgi:serine/threonine-protein kinase
MATVHLGRLLGEAGFSRTVAIKRLHEHLAKDPDFVAMFLDEARLASRVRHPNVVSILDVVVLDKEVFLVMDYVQGASVSRLARSARTGDKRIPPKITLSIMVGALHGLHAAHEAIGENGQSLGIVHRDVSPQNILVDVDGVARVIDFGVAKAGGRLQSTRQGSLKGKIQYMPPEQIRGEPIDRRADIYAASVVLWELLSNRKLFKGQHDVSLMHEILERTSNAAIEPPSQRTPGLPKSLDNIVLQGLSARPDDRWQSARDMAIAIEKALVVASTREVGDWVREEVGDELREKADKIAEFESLTSQPAFEVHELLSQPTASSGISVISAPNTGVISSLPTPGGTTIVSQQSSSSGRHVVILSAGVAIGIIGLGIIGAYTLVHSATSTVSSDSPHATAPPSATIQEETPTIQIDQLMRVTEDADVVVEEPDSQEPEASARPVVRPPVIKPAGNKDKPPPSPTKPPAGTTPPAAQCDPPFTVDANGIKRFKPECLR